MHTSCKMIYFIYQQHGGRKAQLEGIILSQNQPQAT